MSPTDTAGMHAGADLEGVLAARLGLPGFRPGQREVITAALSGRDAVAVLPTGGGKSLTYQLPALVSGRCTLVISPLVALMHDQVESARRKGLRAELLESGLSDAQRADILRRVREGAVELLYASPEGMPHLAADLEGTGPFGLFAVDEAHCISQWGHDFRPDYRRLAEMRARVAPSSPILAVTATATERVERDIVENLRLVSPLVVRTSFFRPNLRLAAWRKDGSRDARLAVASLLAAHGQDAAIVYRTSRAGATALAGWLRSRGVAASAYHAGLDPERRSSVQDAFLTGECRVVVATVAFGMGVDKADVRLVVHADLPGSLEAYAQEVGRAGRDGQDSDCVLMYSWRDVQKRDAMLAAADPQRQPVLRDALRETYRFAAMGRCRHRVLCGHFGETVAVPCGACDSCGAISASRLLRRGGW